MQVVRKFVQAIPGATSVFFFGRSPGIHARALITNKATLLTKYFVFTLTPCMLYLAVQKKTSHSRSGSEPA